MQQWSLLFLVLAALTALLGFGRITPAAGLMEVLCLVFGGLFVLCVGWSLLRRH